MSHSTPTFFFHVLLSSCCARAPGCALCVVYGVLATGAVVGDAVASRADAADPGIRQPLTDEAQGGGERVGDCNGRRRKWRFAIVLRLRYGGLVDSKAGREKASVHLFSFLVHIVLAIDALIPFAQSSTCVTFSNLTNQCIFISSVSQNFAMAEKPPY